MSAAIYFTTEPRPCRCSVENDDEGLNIDNRASGVHYERCPARCQHAAIVDRFGRVAGSQRPLSRVQCVGEHDHDGDHRAVSPIGGHSAWWSDLESSEVFTDWRRWWA